MAFWKAKDGRGIEGRRVAARHAFADVSLEHVVGGYRAMVWSKPGVGSLLDELFDPTPGNVPQSVQHAPIPRAAVSPTPAVNAAAQQALQSAITGGISALMKGFGGGAAGGAGAAAGGRAAPGMGMGGMGGEGAGSGGRGAGGMGAGGMGAGGSPGAPGGGGYEAPSSLAGERVVNGAGGITADDRAYMNEMVGTTSPRTLGPPTSGWDAPAQQNGPWPAAPGNGVGDMSGWGDPQNQFGGGTNPANGVGDMSGWGDPQNQFGGGTNPANGVGDMSGWGDPQNQFGGGTNPANGVGDMSGWGDPQGQFAGGNNNGVDPGFGPGDVSASGGGAGGGGVDPGMGPGDVSSGGGGAGGGGGGEQTDFGAGTGDFGDFGGVGGLE